MAKTMANKYAGPCATCGAWIPAGLGVVIGHRAGRSGPYTWTLTHKPPAWRQWGAFDGEWLYGCPEPVTRKARTVQSVTVDYVLMTDAGKIGAEGLTRGASLEFRKISPPPVGVRIVRRFTFEPKPACVACKARPASDGWDYCRSPQCIAGRERAAERLIKATFQAA